MNCAGRISKEFTVKQFYWMFSSLVDRHSSGKRPPPAVDKCRRQASKASKLRSVIFFFGIVFFPLTQMNCRGACINFLPKNVPNVGNV